MAMDKKSAPTSLYRDRRSFAKIPDVMDVPNLIAIQTESFDWFKNEGLAQAFAAVPMNLMQNKKADYIDEGAIERERWEPEGKENLPFSGRSRQCPGT